MARILTNGQFATTGIPVSITGWFQQQPDGTYNVKQNSAIKLSNGICLIADTNWSGIRMNVPCLFLAEKLNSGPHRLADFLIGTHYARLSKTLILSDGGVACDIDVVLNNYMNSWKLLNDAEKAAFLSGAQAAVSGTLCGWQSYAFLLDCVTPGGPAIPIFSGLLALTSGAICVNGLQNMSAAAKVAAQEAVKMRRYAADLNQLVVQVGGDNSTILFTPGINTYCTGLADTCAGIENLARQTVGNIGLLFHQTPGLQFAP
ncbi:hypothetical protein [Synechococcus sp. CCAP 1479/9]|uniref:hypothetical protein n=1 Tax=Synechococcus sp. CCAP 1479/9 TaxID=1221593 RepID=UPI001C217BC4|nr:hypothetical protein [Synechococcus sp. CCAP 1479/9]